jgi:hypothetical protein
LSRLPLLSRFFLLLFSTRASKTGPIISPQIELQWFPSFHLSPAIVHASRLGPDR